MDVFTSASELLRHHRPERPVLALRPHAAQRAAKWFLANFPGRVLYAAKANDAPQIIEALAEAGITAFDVASLVEIQRMAAVKDAELYFMNPVSRGAAISRAYREFGVRRFAFDSADELDKVIEETDGADDLTLFLRIACPNTHSLIPLEGKFGASQAEAPELLLKARQRATRLGITFHVGSQAVVPAAFGEAIRQVGQLIVSSGVLVDAIDIGGGFPSRYPHSERPIWRASWTRWCVPRTNWRSTLASLLCEPGRALVAEAESVIVRVDARRDNALYLNDGAFGTLFDAAYSGFRFPARLVTPSRGRTAPEAEFVLYGPTCDSSDYLPGPFMLPASVTEGDYLEIGQIGAYGRVLANRFNGFGVFDEVVLTDEPMLSMYESAEDETSQAAWPARA
ncbi:decarboxylase [Methyloceanibacter superfactus]|uniref:ornithine decarboxylase n=1 Tax=Methyloceanibacter superfactus TaxID=1774969 RepID=A0A1E3W1N6_9HYPH|nr:decarboxylase [Methyloceanibacter superfactus]ODR99714.1 decarboxylase [Methyloceanibacter superfactus]